MIYLLILTHVIVFHFGMLAMALCAASGRMSDEEQRIGYPNSLR